MANGEQLCQCMSCAMSFDFVVLCSTPLSMKKHRIKQGGLHWNVRKKYHEITENEEAILNRVENQKWGIQISIFLGFGNDCSQCNSKRSQQYVQRSPTSSTISNRSAVLTRFCIWCDWRLLTRHLLTYTIRMNNLLITENCSPFHPYHCTHECVTNATRFVIVWQACAHFAMMNDFQRTAPLRIIRRIGDCR